MYKFVSEYIEKIRVGSNYVSFFCNVFDTESFLEIGKFDHDFIGNGVLRL